jgi:hypothetical protein
MAATRHPTPRILKRTNTANLIIFGASHRFRVVGWERLLVTGETC